MNHLRVRCWWRSRLARFPKTIVCLVGTPVFLGILPVTTAPSALAWSDAELQFFTEVKALGMAGPQAQIGRVVKVGWDICTQLGTFPGTVIAENIYLAIEQPSVTHAKAEAVVKSAARNLCPGSYW